MNKKPQFFKNKKIAVVGLGVEGLSSARYLKKHGANVFELDQKQGKDYLKNLDQFDMIIRSPGIKRNTPEIVSVGVIITSQTQLFFDLCPCEIIGVTGTKGKGTTSALIYEMLKKEGLDAYLGGNIGEPPFNFLDKLNPQSKVVLELSSYQLQDLTKSPHISVILMITQEHLAPDKKDSLHQNYHETLEEYVDAKRNILRFQTSNDFAILNRDYPVSNELDIHTNTQVFQVSTKRSVDQGCCVQNGKIVVQGLERIQNSKFKIQNLENVIIDTTEILLPGRHNWENVCAAVMAANLARVSKKAMVSVLTSFKGLEHRLELVGEIGGVRYYDDSFSTTPETAIAAIQAFTQPEVVILGGAHKGSNFSDLGKTIADAKNIRAIVGVGVEWPRIKDEILKQVQNDKVPPMIEGAKDMETIVLAASKIAKSGDVVLLSPACSSFDMFKNYKERGEQFKKEVLELNSKFKVQNAK